MQRLFLLFLWIMPNRLFSRLVGHLTRVRWPGFILRPFLKWYIGHYKVNVSEIEKDLSEFKTITEFFTRTLKPGVRPLAEGENVLLCPVDGAMSQSGRIQEGTLIQAKGSTYTAAELLDNAEASKRFHNGSFMTIYLSPRDYHRMHTPLAGSISSYHYVPGALLPVNPPSVAYFKGLFARNERLISYIDYPVPGEEGKTKQVAFVKVGATNVGRIRLSYKDFVTNRWGFPSSKSFVLDNPVELGAGDELAIFEMGSTIVMLFEPGVELDEISLDEKVRLGQKIGKIG